MSKVRFEISMSLDGYVTAADPSVEEPMGDGGQVLHEWAFNADDAGREMLNDSEDTVGASIAGRLTYDRSIADWGADGPGLGRRTPTFIVSHDEPGDVPQDSVYTFAASPEQALDQALGAAGDKDVDIFSANVGAQLLRAGRIDELRIHLVPVLLGSGTRLLDDLGERHVRLRRTHTSESAMATHLRYELVKTV
jgi:dihydrofolate reductase